MTTGPFGRLLPVYTLDFGTVSVQAHLSKKRDLAAQIAGLQTETKELVAQCHNPKAGSPLIQHGMKATVSPSWDGLTGTFTVTGEPDSDPFAVTRALGRVYYGTFEQSAESVDDSEGWEDWTLRRFVASEEQTDSISEDGAWTSLGVIRLSFVTTKPADELDLLAPDAAEVVANIGTLKKGDLVSHPVRGTYQVRGNPVAQGEYERARVEKG